MEDRVPLAEGREAEVFLLPDGTVLKLLRDPGAELRTRAEAEACRALRDAGQAAPRIHRLVTLDGRPGLVMDHIEGGTLLAALERRPQTVLTAARAMAQTHAALHRCSAPPALPELNARLRQQILQADPLSDALREPVLDLLDGLPGGDRICHGDLHLDNLLGNWSEPVAIDWGDAARGAATADVARTVLLHQVGTLPSGTSRFFRGLTRAGRGLLCARYLAAYRRERPVDDGELERWRLVRAAARLQEPVADEHAACLDLVERGLRVTGS